MARTRTQPSVMKRQCTRISVSVNLPMRNARCNAHESSIGAAARAPTTVTSDSRVDRRVGTGSSNPADSGVEDSGSVWENVPALLRARKPSEDCGLKRGPLAGSDPDGSGASGNGSSRNIMMNNDGMKHRMEKQEKS